MLSRLSGVHGALPRLERQKSVPLWETTFGRLLEIEIPPPLFHLPIALVDLDQLGKLKKLMNRESKARSLCGLLNDSLKVRFQDSEV